MSERNASSPSSEILAQTTPPEGTPPSMRTPETLAQALQRLPEPRPTEEEARARVAALDREAKALGSDRAAAVLFHEIGLLWEDPLGNARNAAVAFQNAYKIAPDFLANIREARRLFADVGNWQMVVQLLDAELGLTPEVGQKAWLLFEKAGILEERLSRHEDASLAYRLALDTEPEDITLLIQLESVYSSRQDFEALVKVYRLLANRLEDPVLRSHYLSMSGLVFEERLKRPEEAAACYREAFALDRKDLSLLSAIKRIAERDGNTDNLLAALAAEAEALGPQAAATHLQTARVYEKLGRQEDALAALLAARRTHPQEPLVLSELARIYEGQERNEELADVLMAWVGCINDDNELSSINLRLGSLFEGKLKRDDEAIARYRAILQKIPGHTEALAALGKLYFRTQNWSGLVSVFDAEVMHSDDSRQKVARMYRAAEILEERLGEIDSAIRRYNDCLQIQPGYLPAHKALIRLFEKLGRYGDLLATYEQELSQTTDRDHTVSTLSKMALLYEERVQDFDRAIACLKRVLDIQPDHLATIRSLARLFERTQQFGELIRLHEIEAGLAGDTKQVLALRHRNAELLEDQLKDRAGAIAEYERLLALSPSYLPALKSLGRLYAQDERWDDLIRMYRAEAEIATSAEQAAALICKTGELYEHKLKSLDAAIASYQEVLTLAPRSFTALRALARIYRTQGAWESLIDVLRSEAANRTDPLERANALFQAAMIWEDQLKRHDMAVAGYQEVLRLTPSHSAAIRALERLYVGQNNVKDLVAVLDREAQSAPSNKARIAGYLKLARLYLDRLNEPSRAAHCCETVLSLEENHLIALKLLERIRAPDRAKRNEIRQHLVENVTDAKLKGALVVAAALDADASDSDAGIAVLFRGIEQDPSNRHVGLSLERALRRRRDFDALSSLYESRLGETKDSQEKLSLALRLAELSENKLDDPPKAARFYRLALELSPGLIPALQGARRCYLRLEDHAQARQMLEAEGGAYKDAGAAQQAFIAAGTLCANKLQDPDGAIANFRKALAHDPLSSEATAGLRDVLSQRGGAQELAELHELRGQAKLARREGAAAAEEFYAASRLWLAKANEPSQALGAVERALSAYPTHLEALELKAQLALEAKRYEDAAAALSARVQQGGDAKKLSALHLQLGGLYQDHLGDLSRAAAHLQTAASGSPDSAEAYKRLANIHTGSRNWTGAADCLRRLLELETDPQLLAEHALALAGILEEGFSDTSSAIALYRRALEWVPGHAQAVQQLAGLYQKTNNLPELIHILETQAEQATDKAHALRLRLQVGGLLADSTREVEKAIGSFRRALDLDHACVDAHVGLARLYMRDAAAAPLAISEHLRILELAPQADSLHALFRLWDGLRETDKTFCAAGLLAFLHSANDVEAAFHRDVRAKLPRQPMGELSEADLTDLVHPWARGGLADILRIMGDQLTKVYPSKLEALGIDKKQDRLKADHVTGKAIRSMAGLLGIPEIEIYQARRGTLFLEATDPPALCIGPELARRSDPREQSFLLARALSDLRNKSALASRLSTGELGDLLGNAIRITQAGFTGLGRKNDDGVKQLKRALSRKSLRALEEVSAKLARSPSLALQPMLDGLLFSADRVGMLFCADIEVGLSLACSGLEENKTPPSAEDRLRAVTEQPALQALFQFALSPEFFRLRQKLKLCA